MVPFFCSDILSTHFHVSKLAYKNRSTFISTTRRTGYR